MLFMHVLFLNNFSEPGKHELYLESFENGFFTDLINQKKNIENQKKTAIVLKNTDLVNVSFSLNFFGFYFITSLKYEICSCCPYLLWV